MGAEPVSARAWLAALVYFFGRPAKFPAVSRTFSDGISDGPPRRFARTPRAPRAGVPYISLSPLYPLSGMPLVVMLSMGMLSLMYGLVAYGMLTWGYGYGIVLM